VHVDQRHLRAVDVEDGFHERRVLTELGADDRMARQHAHPENTRFWVELPIRVHALECLRRLDGPGVVRSELLERDDVDVDRLERVHGRRAGPRTELQVPAGRRERPIERVSRRRHGHPITTEPREGDGGEGHETPSKDSVAPQDRDRRQQHGGRCKVDREDVRERERS
jgi:hypothetical protein